MLARWALALFASGGAIVCGATADIAPTPDTWVLLGILWIMVLG